MRRLVTIIAAVCAVVLLTMIWQSEAARRENPPVTLSQTYCIGSQPCVTTYHNDLSRDGVNPNETILKASSFPKLFRSASPLTTRGLIYTQPLYIRESGTSTCTGGKTSASHMVFVATEEDYVYAYDDSGNPCWSEQLVNSGETAVPTMDTPGPCGMIVPEYGITGTPVIDVSVTPPIMYVVTSELSSSKVYTYRLHAIDVTTGNEETGWGSPFDLGAALGSNFNAQVQLQRAGLALYDSGNIANVYIAWTSYCDSNSAGDYNGWLGQVQINYAAGNPALALEGYFSSEPLPSGLNDGGIWMGGGAPSVDGLGNPYLVVANGNYDGGTSKWGQSIIQLAPATPSNCSAPPCVLSVTDYYTPNAYKQLDLGVSAPQYLCNQYVPLVRTCPAESRINFPNDMDVGASDAVLITPNGYSTMTPLVVTAGKEGVLYVDYYQPGVGSTMGGLDSCGYGVTTCPALIPQQTACTEGSPGPGNLSQCFPATTKFTNGSDANGIRGSVAFWNPPVTSQIYNLLLVAGINDVVNVYNTSTAATFNTTPASTAAAPNQEGKFGYPGAVPSVSWNSAGNAYDGILWVLDTTGFGTVIDGQSIPATASYLTAYSVISATNGSVSLSQLWTSYSAFSPDPNAPGAVKFVVPTIANGKVFIAGGEGGSTPYDPAKSGTNCVPNACTGWLTIYQTAAGLDGR